MFKQIATSITILAFFSLSTACGWIADTIEEAGADAVGDRLPKINLEAELTEPGNQFNVPLESGGTVTATVSDADGDGQGEGLDMNGSGNPNILYGDLSTLKTGSSKSGARNGEKFVTVKLVGDESIIDDALLDGVTDFYGLDGISGEFYILVNVDTSETSVEDAVELEFYDNPNFNGEPYEFISTPLSETQIQIDGIGQGGVVSFDFFDIIIEVE